MGDIIGAGPFGVDFDNWDGFWSRQFFFYFVAIGYFLVIVMQTMGTMFGDRNQVEVRNSNNPALLMGNA